MLDILTIPDTVVCVVHLCPISDVVHEHQKRGTSELGSLVELKRRSPGGFNFSFLPFRNPKKSQEMVASTMTRFILFSLAACATAVLGSPLEQRGGLF